MSDPVLLGPDDGVSTHKRFRIKAALDELVLTEIRHTPGKFEPPPHIHHHHADGFYVLEGEMSFLVEDTYHLLGPGELIFAPPGLVHTYRSPGSVPARMLNLHAPGMGFDRYILGDRDFGFDQHPPPDDGGLPASAGLIGRPGERLELGPGATAQVLVGGEDGIGSLTVFEVEVGPGFHGPPPHHHEQLVDSFFVLEGAPSIQLGDEVVEAGRGSYALVPPGNVHTFSNPGPEPARLLVIQAPGGFERYVKELAAVGGPGADPAKIAEIAARHDVHFA